MSNFRLYSLILLLSLTTLQVTEGFKCQFPLGQNANSCTISPDSDEVEAKYSSDKITNIKYEGNDLQNLVDFTNADYPICEKFPNLKEIEIRNVKSFDAKMLESCKHFESLEIYHANIDELSENFFGENVGIDTIKLSMNKISKIHEKSFTKLKKLKHLILDHNEISTLPPNVFKSLPSLWRLDLGHNKISTLQPEWFDDLKVMFEISLDYNQLSDLPKDVFSKLQVLNNLRLNNNGIKFIHSDSFGKKTELHEMDLRNNGMIGIDEKFFEKIPKLDLAFIDMDNNVCLNKTLKTGQKNKKEKFVKCFENYLPRGLSKSLKCRLPSFGKHATVKNTYFCVISPDLNKAEKEYVPEDITEIEYDGEDEPVDFTYADYPICVKFPNLRKVEIKKAKSFNGKILENCKHIEELKIRSSNIEEIGENFFGQNVGLKNIDLWMNKISTIHEKAFANMEDLTDLNLNGNQITTLAPNVFKSLVNIDSLHLAYNNISELKPEWFEGLKDLRVISLDANKLSDLPEGIFSKLNKLVSLSLNDNKLTTVHSDSFSKDAKLNDLRLANNGVTAIDEKLFDVIPNPKDSVIDMENNICYNETLDFGTGKKKEKLIKCFENYKPREKPTRLKCEIRIIGWKSVQDFCILTPELAVETYKYAPEDITYVKYERNDEDELIDITHADFPICDRFPNLKKLYIEKTKSFDTKILESCKNIEELEIHSSNIEEIGENFFAGSESVQEINLSNNKISKIHENAFAKLSELTNLVLDDNELETLPTNVFKPLTKLGTLDLGHNNFETLQQEWFNDVAGVYDLSIDHNKLTDLPKDIFSKLNKVVFLRLHGNNLTTLHSDSFGEQTKLENLNLRYNQIAAIDEKIIDKISDLKDSLISLESNVCLDKNLDSDTADKKKELAKCFENYKPREKRSSLKCDIPTFAFEDNNYYCEIIPDLVKEEKVYAPEDITWISYEGNEEKGLIDFTHADFPICDKFPNLKKIHIKKVKSFDLKVLDNCKHIDDLLIQSANIEKFGENYFGENVDLKEIDFSNNKISTIHEKTFAKLTKLTVLDLENNQITTLPTNVFKSLTKLGRLDLGGNKIETLQHEWFEDFVDLYDLSLDHNKLSDLPKDIFSKLKEIIFLRLNHNNLTNIHSDSFGKQTKLENLKLDFNGMIALDEKILDKIANLADGSLIDMEDNVCLNKNLGSETPDKKKEFAKCFENYKPRETSSRLKCDIPTFRFEENTYYCEILLDLVGEEKKYAPEKITDISFEGSDEKGLVDFTRADFPLCDKFPNLKNIEVKKTKSFELKILENCKHLTKLTITSSTIEEIGEDFFGENINLEEVDLRINKITTVHEKSLAKLSKLNILTLENNQISTLPPNIFKSITKLNRLDLGSNNVETLQNEWFADFEKIVDISFDHNKITELPKEVFSKLNKLAFLRLNHNNLTTLHSDSFGKQIKLIFLNLDSNQITAVDEKFFDNLSDLGEFSINMENNGCLDKNVDSGEEDKKSGFEKCFGNYKPREKRSSLKCHVPTDEEHGYSENPYFCVISPDLVGEEQKFDPEDITDIVFDGSKEHGPVDFTHADFPICDKFPNLEKIEIKKVKSFDPKVLESCKKIERIRFYSSNIEEIGENFFGNNFDLNDIEFYGNKITTIHEKSFANLNNLVDLNLNNNQITTLPTNIFKSLQKIRILNLSFNKIETLQPEWFEDLRDLAVLLLDRNKISELPKNVFSKLGNLNNINLSYNNLTVIHANSFGKQAKLNDVNLGNNKITAIDEQLFGILLQPDAPKINMENNVCLNKDPDDEEKSKKEDFAKCFENYKPREGDEVDQPSSGITCYLASNEEEADVENIDFCPMSGSKQKQDPESITEIEFDGNDKADFTNENFPICEKFPNLKQIEIKNVNSFDSDVLESCQHIETLKIHSSNIEEIKSDFFGESVGYKNVNLWLNKISKIHEKAFENLKELTTLGLNGNQITTLPPDVFKTLSNLENLYLAHNNIQELDLKWFDGLKSLQTLTLHNNKISELPKNVFKSLENLLSVSLNDNKLTTIHSDSFSKQAELNDLNLSNNRITAIDGKIFDVVQEEFSMIDMENNLCYDKNLQYGSEDKKEKLAKCFENYKPREKVVRLKCHLPPPTEYPFTPNTHYCVISPDLGKEESYAPENITKIEFDGNKADEPVDFTNDEYPICEKFPNLETVELKKLNSFDAKVLETCKYIHNLKIQSSNIEEIGENFFGNNHGLLVVDLSMNKISKIQENAFTNLKELEELKLDNNQIQSLPPNVFSPLANVFRLKLGHNNIQTLKPEWFDNFMTLNFLSLDHNNISELPKNVFSKLGKLMSLDVQNNSLSIIHSDSFSKKGAITGLNLNNNGVIGIDEKLFDIIPTSEAVYIEMENNVCLNKGVGFGESSKKEDFVKCFENYKILKLANNIENVDLCNIKSAFLNHE